MDSARSLALAAFTRWRNGREFADKIVHQTLTETSLGRPDRAFALELFYGLLRNLTLLDFWIAQLRPAPVDHGSRGLLRLGLYQIMFLETASHAAVFETVELAPKRARNLINAILRRALREKDALTNAARLQPLHVNFSEPEFLVARWTRQFGPENTLDLCRWNNRPAPVYARINRLETTAADFMARHRESFLLPDRENFVGLSDPVALSRSADGYIQDPSTELACDLLRPAPGEMVLDACAAPGGKTAYLAEMMSNKGDLFATDQDEARLSRLRENLVRLKVKNTHALVCNWMEESSIRAARFEDHFFDKILLDAPCTNTGVMRRRVDVRWRVQPDDFVRMQRQQLAILKAVAPLLKSGGMLVYSTCSLEPEENEEVVARFLREHPAFRLTSSKQSLPWRDHFDGAFAARLQFS